MTDYRAGVHPQTGDRWELTVDLSADGYAESRPLAQIPLGRQRTEDEAVAAAERMLARCRWERIGGWERATFNVGGLLGLSPVSYRAALAPLARRSYTLNNGLYRNCDCIGAMLSAAPVPEGLAAHPIVAAHTATYGDVYLLMDHPDLDEHARRDCEHFTVVV